MLYGNSEVWRESASYSSTDQNNIMLAGVRKICTNESELYGLICSAYLDKLKIRRKIYCNTSIMLRLQSLRYCPGGRIGITHRVNDDPCRSQTDATGNDRSFFISNRPGFVRQAFLSLPVSRKRKGTRRD